MKIPILIVAIALSGCAEIQHQRIMADRASCAAQGYEEGPYFEECMNRAQADRAARKAALSGLSSALLAQPRQYTLPAQPATHTYMQNGRMVTCTTTGTVTNCF